MLPMSQELIEAASQLGAVPKWWLDIYGRPGPSSRIVSQSQWIASSGAQKARDSNVDFDRHPGSVVLAPGAPVASAYAGPDHLVGSFTYIINRTDGYHYGGFWNPNHIYDWTRFTVKRRDPGMAIPFVAGATQIVDELNIRADYDGHQSMICIARIVDANGNQIGRAASFMPAAGITTYTLTYLAAGLIFNRQYTLIIDYTPPANGTIPGPFGFSTSYDYTHTINIRSFSVTASQWTIEAGGGRFSMGGRPGYIGSGELWRIIDVGSIPAGSGNVTFSDRVPNGTSMTILAWYTDSAVIAAEADETNWIFYGQVASGDEVPAHRCWLFHISMTSDASQSLTPELIELAVKYAGDPIRFGMAAKLARTSEAGQMRLSQIAFPLLHSAISFSAGLNPALPVAMRSRTKFDLLPGDESDALLALPLKGKPVVGRVGFAGTEDTVEVSSYLVDDIRYTGGHYEIEVMDDFRLADASVPAENAGDSWNDVTDYAINDIAVHGSGSWLALVASGPGAAVEPGTDPAVWQDNGTVWADVIYTAATNSGVDWHLADIAIDLLTNHVNLPTERIDIESILALKTKFPNRSGSRILSKPQKAATLLAEVAWLLEAQFLRVGNQLSMVPEPAAGEQAVEWISDSDIKHGSLTYRRGWREVVNVGVMLAGYGGEGDDGNAYFSQGSGYINAASVAEYDASISGKPLEDRWSMPVAEREARLATAIDVYADGRRVVTLTADNNYRLMRLAAGNVVMLQSVELPAGDPGPLRMMAANIDEAANNELKITLLEVN